MAEAEERLSSSLESSGDNTVTPECLQELLEVFVNGLFRAKNTDRRYEVIQKRCLHFFARDYKLEVIDNKQGQLCGHYPSEIIITESPLDRESPSRASNSGKELRELFGSSKLARCRSRFVLPVILFEDKNICRSATLSTTAELYGRSGVEWFTGGEPQGPERQRSPPSPTLLNESGNSETEWALLSKIRGQDIQLMKTLGISLICDLMVEKKKQKFGLYVASSEKVDKWARYSDFIIAAMPYPGCEFFKDYKDNGYNPVALQFDWSQSFIDVELQVPDLMKSAIPVPCKSYQDWDLVLITQNYLKMLLVHLLECEGGMLIHCISGWDRTPLFISIIRLSLWADGSIHESLTPAEVLYLTLAYDWLLCGHQLKERHEKGEEVLYFCFDFLKYMTSEEYSIHGKPRSSKKIPTSSVANGGSELTTSQDCTVGDPGTRLLSPLAFDGESLSNSQEQAPETTHSTKQQAPQTTPSTDQHNTAHPTPNGLTRAQLLTQRSQRLSDVRQIFITSYKSSVPLTASPQNAGTLSGITGFFSRLADSVLSGNGATSV